MGYYPLGIVGGCCEIKTWVCSPHAQQPQPVGVGAVDGDSGSRRWAEKQGCNLAEEDGGAARSHGRTRKAPAFLATRTLGNESEARIGMKSVGGKFTSASRLYASGNCSSSHQRSTEMIRGKVSRLEGTRKRPRWHCTVPKPGGWGDGPRADNLLLPAAGSEGTR